jgi:ferredoxin
VSTTFIAMFVAILAGVGLLLGIGVLSLLSGTINFLFVKPKITFLKSTHGKEGFAFGFSWGQSAEEVSYNQIRIQMFNPFGNPKQLEVTRTFSAHDNDFAEDLNLGDTFTKMTKSEGFNDAIIELTVFATKDSTSFNESMKGFQFLEKLSNATETSVEFNKKNEPVKDKFKYKVPERSFIAPALPKSAKALKLATNPEFAGQFAGGGEASGGAAVANYSISKVWIEPGCIVCNACEGIFPEVFEVTDTTCLIRPGAPLNDGLKVQEAAEACPVEVIKFTKVG